MQLSAQSERERSSSANLVQKKLLLGHNAARAHAGAYCCARSVAQRCVAGLGRAVKDLKEVRRGARWGARRRPTYGRASVAGDALDRASIDRNSADEAAPPHRHLSP